MPIDDLTALGQKMREARKNKDLTQQELADLSHVSVKQIANIEKGKMNPSYLILRALAKVLHISLDTLINPDISLEDEGVNQMKIFYSYYPVRTGKRQGYRQKEKAEEGAAKKRRSSLRKWSIYPCYESLESWVRISFTPAFVFSKSQRKWERLSASGKNDKKES